MSFREVDFETDGGFDNVTVRTPVNIAVIKYWGKRDETLNLPLNSSVSVTLSMDSMFTETTATKSNETVFCINGNIEAPSKRFQRLIKRVGEESEVNVNVSVNTFNTFPTAAGLASSASGFAASATVMKLLYKTRSSISELARLGSGSACRSTYGGFVRWNAGVKEDGSDSVAIQIAPASHWPHLRVLVCVVCKDMKSVPSTIGMQRSVETSNLLKYRVQTVESKIDKLTRAIRERDFKAFAEVTMRDSNEMHAICLDSYPPISYLSAVSHRIINFVHDYNSTHGVTLAYTFDAGPNAVLFCERENVEQIKSELSERFLPGGEVHEIIECGVGTGPLLKQ